MLQGKIEVANNDGTYVIKLSGDVRLNLCPALEAYLENMFLDTVFKTVLIDLSEADGVDSTTLGHLAKISIQCKAQFGFIPSIISPREDITRILLSMGFDQVFYVLGEMPEQMSELSEITCKQVDEELMRNKVIAAHKILMSLNVDNKNAFQELVNCLQADNKF